MDYEIRSIDVEDIVVGERMRSTTAERVSSLASSMQEIGLRTPISVRVLDSMEIEGQKVVGVPVLIAGATRLAAAKKLGWPKIDCMVLPSDDVDAQLWEIDENLARAELTAAQTADHMARRKALWEKKKTGTTRPSLGGRGNEGFASDTSSKTGQSKRDINRAVARGEKIAPDVLQAVQGTNLDTGVALDKLAKMPVEEQRKAVQTRQLPISTGIERKPGVDASESRLKAAQRAYNALNDDERRIFLEWLEENEPAIFDSTPSGRAA